MPRDEYETGFEVQIHGEWSGRDDVMDESFYVEDWDAVRRVVREECPVGVIYLVIDNETGRTVAEGTKGERR